MRRILSVFLLIAIILPVKLYSQTIDRDSTSINYLTSEDDSVQSLADAYTSLEPQVLADIDWLNNTPIRKEDQEMRNEKSRFVLMWMSGSPSVSIQMDDRVLTFLGAEPSILMAYMMGWAKYALENNYSDDAIQCSVAGVTSAVSFYTTNRKSFKKNRELEKYKEMIETGALSRHIADVLTRP